jgi:hypothetical protein
MNTMNEERLLGAAIRILGLSRIFVERHNALCFVIVKDLGLKTPSGLPVAVDLQGFVFNLLLGAAIILGTPAILHVIYGRKPVAQSVKLIEG